MKKILATVLFTSMAFFSANAYALTITPGSEEGYFQDTNNSNLNTLAEINAAFGTSFTGTGTMLYKTNSGGGEEGSLAGSYTSSFDDGGADGFSSGLISYVGPTAFDCSDAANPCLLIVKDGDAGQYLFNLSNILPLGTFWNGTEILVLDGFWEGIQGAISNVAIWGVSTTTTTTTDTTTTDGSTVPEPGILALLGVGLGLGAQRLRRRKA